MPNTGIDARSTVLAFVLLALGVTFSGALVAGTDDRAQMVRNLYRDFIFQGMWCDKAKMSKYFSADIVKDTVRKCDADEEIEYAIIPGNDFLDDEVMGTLKVSPASGSAYEASFRSFGESYTVTYTFEKQGGQWRITEIE